MLGELFQHPEAVDRMLRRVMEDVELDEVHREAFPSHDIERR
jgi:hypothetical protein